MKNFEAIKWTDIKGHDLYYIKLTNGDKSHLINVGKKTFENVNEITKPSEQQQLPLKEEQPKKNGGK